MKTNEIIARAVEDVDGWEATETTVQRILKALFDAGLVVVPREPTIEMDEAPRKILAEVGSFTAREVWQSMIGAHEDG